MKTSMDFHSIVAINVSTKLSGETMWTCFTFTDKTGSEVEVTAFHAECQPISIFLEEKQ